MRQQREAMRLVRGFFDERIAIIACEVDPDGPAGLAVSQLADTMPELLDLIDTCLSGMQAVQDMVAVAEEHVT
jgi:hypothetical protein